MSENHFLSTQVGDISVLEIVATRFAEVAESDNFLDQIRSLVRPGEPQKIVMDFRHLTLVPSSMIMGLILLKKQLQLHGGQLCLCEMTNEVYGQFRRLNLEGSVLEIHQSRAEALAALGDQ